MSLDASRLVKWTGDSSQSAGCTGCGFDVDVERNVMAVRTMAALAFVVMGLSVGAVAADPPQRVPRTVFNDDAQVLREAPGENPAPFIKAWLDRESAAVPFSTFVFLASTPDICFYNTKAGEEYGARRKKDDYLYVRAMRALKRQGTDALRLVTEHMQAKGKEVLAAIRMSDTHHRRLNVYDELCPQFAIDHPEYVIKQPDGRTNETALDYSIEAVRDHRMGIMAEIIHDYPVDGLELNFVRWAKHFPRDQGRQKAPVMTRYVERIRKMMDSAGRTRKNGKRLTLGVRVPESLHACWLAGVDIETWVKRGWIDFVVVSTWNNTDPQLRVDEFAKFTRPAGVDTIVTMGNMIGAMTAGPPVPVDRGVAKSGKHAAGYVSMLLNTEEARGAAANFYTYGADSISFWNVGIHFGREVTATPQQRRRIEEWTHAVGSPERVWEGTRTYRFLPMGKGISSRKPPVRNYPWYDEGASPLGHKNSPTLLFSADNTGKRLILPFRMADGRHGESLTGRMTFWIYHLEENDKLAIDINGKPIAERHLKRFPAGARRSGLPGTRFELKLENCPPLRGDNQLGVVLKTKAVRAHVPFLEELEVTVAADRKRTTAGPQGVKIYIAVDSEGPTGVNEYWARNLKPGDPKARRYRELMTDDVNAAVAGSFAAGATEVYVKDDGFRDKNLIADRLDPRAVLLPGGGGLLHGLDDTFQGVMLVGLHAMEGAADGVLAHTWSSGRRRRYWFNEREGGEVAAYAIVAGHDHRVPIIMVTGCSGVCRETRELLGPAVVGVSVKRRLQDGSVELDSPETTRRTIAAGARHALTQITQYRPYQVKFPLRVRLQLKNREVTDGYEKWRHANKPDWPGKRAGPNTLEAILKTTKHIIL